MSRTNIAKQAKSRKKPAARKGNGAAKPPDRAGPDVSALDLPALYALFDATSKRLDEKEAERLQGWKPHPLWEQVSPIVDRLHSLAAQIDVASEAAANVNQEALERTLYELAQAVKAEGNTLHGIFRMPGAESEAVS
jgi:hypothetical protein